MRQRGRLRVPSPSVIIFAMTQMIRAELTIRARFFRGLGDPSRLAILDGLAAGERTAGEVAAAAGLTPSNASRHLACLKDCGVVEARQDWRYVYYRLAAGVPELVAATGAFIETVADHIAACERLDMGGSLHVASDR